MRVDDILNSKSRVLVTIPQASNIREAGDRISSARVGMLLVVDEQQKLVGTLSERDIVCFTAAYGSKALSEPVEVAMSKAPSVVTPQDSVAHVMRVMTEQRVRHTPVIDRGNLVGVLSIGDILKSRLAEKDQETAVLRDMARASLVGHS